MNSRAAVFVCLAILLGLSNVVMAQQSNRVILFMIDGLHWQAPQKANMSNFASLIDEGTYIQKSYVVIPHHPTIGDYSEFNTCSFPNPVLHAGTVFVKPENNWIQEVLPTDRQSAFVVNTSAYRSVSRGFTTTVMDATLTDREVVEYSIELLENQDPAFMRIHLQTSGELGRSVSIADPSTPYFRNIFGEDSPYVASIENADKLLGELVSYLKESGKWDSTVLIVTSDHGQSKTGWHPMLDEDSWVTPMVFAGAGIASNRSLPYFEHTDLSPTIAHLLGVQKPNNDGGSGDAVTAILSDSEVSEFRHARFVKTINEQIRQFNLLKSHLVLASAKDAFFGVVLASLENENLTPEPFYHQDRITEWHKAESVEHMIKANAKILDQMRRALEN